jgi:hypothetical protein
MSVVSRQGRQMKETGSGIVSDMTMRTESRKESVWSPGGKERG